MFSGPFVWNRSHCNVTAMPEPPYGIIASELKQGAVVPFLGAAASSVAKLAGAVFNPRNPTCMPSALELAHTLAHEARFPSDDAGDRGDLAKVSSYYVEVSGRVRLRTRLRQLLNPTLPPGSAPLPRLPTLHRLLARCPSPQVIVTTNYDSLIEDAFDEIQKPYDLVVYPAERSGFGNAVIWWPHGKEPVERAPNELDKDIDLQTTTVVFKMHGTTHRLRQSCDHFVITEEDYVEFLSRMTTNAAIPSMFYPHFRNRSFLFLGYGLKDWNLRVLLKNLNRQLTMKPRLLPQKPTDENEDAEPSPSLPSWAIQLKPSELERTLWETRNVKIFDVGLDAFVTELSKELEQLGISM